ncbi:hypothetical protein BKA82DRAFT_23271 [Pisolithus tinctorius]|uniref:Uncharacterized protein n=1 Tax=Pisolithus tinctorius Marx 270 TaxID=870435 RepID=A0A0C3P4N2_PISTI|nr:hypothetical protein BKA82DRAFT_23271 [Pisolithus tinctorius]KIO08020.1 hypothetical protein M404DRAFT_23271 [Pisolithus tinctorius Marx 270]
MSCILDNVTTVCQPVPLHRCVLDDTTTARPSASQSPCIAVSSMTQPQHTCLPVVPVEDLQKVQQDHVKFKCVCCHWKQTRGEAKPYLAFYSKGEPVLPNPPHLKGVFEHATASQVASLPTALVHLHLETLQVGQAQVNMVNDFLQAYFPNKAYSFSKLPFNLATQDTQATYQKAATSPATSLSSYPSVVIFLTTHSDEDRGDLFAGYDEDSNPHASQVFQVLQLLLTPLAEVIEGADMVFYVCGSVVTEAQSFNGVKQAAKL